MPYLTSYLLSVLIFCLFTFFIISHTTLSNNVFILCSGMKPLNCSVEACLWEGTGHTSATMTGVSQDLRLWIICMSCWGATTTLGLRWLAIRLCSCSKSSSRPMSLKTSKDAMGQRTLKTIAICTGTLSGPVLFSMLVDTTRGIVVAPWKLAQSPFSWAQCCCLCVQVPHTISPQVFSNKASVERPQWPAQTHSLGWLRRITAAGKHCPAEVCCHGEKEKNMFQLLRWLLWLMLCEKWSKHMQS